MSCSVSRHKFPTQLWEACRLFICHSLESQGCCNPQDLLFLALSILLIGGALYLSNHEKP